MNKIVTSKGEYLTNKFTGVNGTWKLIGSNCSVNKPMKCIDTFKNDITNEYVSIVREKVFEFADKGSIWNNF